LIVVAFLLPLAVYCLVLGLINRRRRPVMVSAAWDFAGLLCAASGLLAFGLPGILMGLSEHGRQVILFGAPVRHGWFGDLYESLCESLFSVGSGVLLLNYFFLVVGVAGFVLWRRQSQTAVYNIRPEVFDEVFAGVLDAAGLLWSRAGQRYFIRRGPKQLRPAEGPAEETESPVTASPRWPSAPGRGSYPTSAEEIEQSACLEVDPAPALCHVTLRWETEDASLRQQVEADLARALAEVRTRHNPTATWLISAGAGLLAVIVLLFAFMVIYKMYFER
jgi:hypothetical protein